MTKKQRTRKKGASNVRRSGGRAGAKRRSIYETAPDIEPRTCICPNHETFWVTPKSTQVYALPACRKREHDRIKKVAFRQFLYDGLRYLGVAIERADEIAQRALKYFYTRFIRMWRALGWVYSPEKATWVKGDLSEKVV